MKLRLMTFMAVSALAGAALAQAPGGPPGGGQGPSPEAQAARQAMLKTCEADAKTLCSGKAGRELMMCLRENSEKVSAPCKEAMSKIPVGPPGPPR